MAATYSRTNRQDRIRNFVAVEPILAAMKNPREVLQPR